MKLAFLFFSMVLVNNLVFTQFLGAEVLLNKGREIKSSAVLGTVVSIVMVLSTAVMWPVYTYLLLPNHLTYLQVLCFVIITAVLAQLIEIIMRGVSAKLYQKVGGYMPAVTANCAVLGIVLLVTSTSSVVDGKADYYTYPEALLVAFGAGVGLLLALLLFAGVRRKVAKARPPKAFEGAPIALVSAAITSLVFMGFDGMLENIFGVVL